jgi:hypothetical protein
MMNTIQATCAKCHAPVSVTMDHAPDPDLWPKLSLMLLCQNCAPKPEPVNRPEKPKREVRLPYADN